METSIDKSIEKIVQNNADNLTLDSSIVQTISKENSNSFATNILPIAVYRIASDESLASDIFDNNKGKVWLSRLFWQELFPLVWESDVDVLLRLFLPIP